MFEKAEFINLVKSPADAYDFITESKPLEILFAASAFVRSASLLRASKALLMEIGIWIPGCVLRPSGFEDSDPF